MDRFFSNHWPIISIIFITLFLCILNYTPGTFLSGWDTLHPEFNFSLNLKRILFGVFRLEQGLGAVAAHSHMVELPRIIFLWMMSLFFPLSFLRYSYVFLMLIIGPLGIYYLSRLILKQNSYKKQKKLNSDYSNVIILSSFLASIWYLLNLGTMQIFIVPFEMFVTQYGLLPWLFFISIRIMIDENKIKRQKLLLLFAVLSFFSSPMAYAATLWYIFFGLFSLFFLISCISALKRKQFSVCKRSLAILLVLLAVNTYWILPNLYFLKTQSANVQEANINKLFSEQAFLYNKEFGTITDILLLKSFFFDWSIFNGHQFELLVKQWAKHLENSYVILIGFSIAGITILGIIFSLWQKSFFRWNFIGILCVILVFLINDNEPARVLFNGIQSLPILKEALRFPHNKVYGIYMFVFAIFFGYGNYFLMSAVTTFHPRLKSISIRAYALSILFLLIVFMVPAFRGQLISPYMRINIPQAYFNLFSWMNRQPETTKAALLPLHSFWGWEYHLWNNGSSPSFQGAGFLWFGMKQPLLHRDFDRWSPYNEQAYKELSYAVYSRNASLLAQVARKYTIGFFILDESIIAPSEEKSVLYYSELKKMLADSKYFKKGNDFGSKLSVYRVNNVNTKPVSLLLNPPSVQPVSKVLYEDIAFRNLGNYITAEEAGSSFIYPFRTLIDNQSRLLPNIFSLTPEGILLKPPPQINVLPTMDLLAFINEETTVPTSITVQRSSNHTEISLYPHLTLPKAKFSPLPIKVTMPLFEDDLTLSINKNSTFSLLGLDTVNPIAIGRTFLSTHKDNVLTLFSSSPDYQKDVDISLQTFSLRPCESPEKKQVFGIEPQGNGFKIFAKNTPLCFLLPLAQLFKKQNFIEPEYLLRTKIAYGENGRYDKTNMCIADAKEGSCLHYLSRFFLPGQARTEYAFATVVSPEDIPNLSLRISLDTTQTQALSLAQFVQITFSLTKPLLITNISPATLFASLTPALKNAREENGIIIPYSGNEQLSRNLASFPRSSGICQENPLVASGKSENFLEDKENFIRYVSEDSPHCDHFSYPNLPHNQSYLLIIKSRNLSGLPFIICVTNRTSKRCDVYARTTPSQSFISDVFLIPPTDSTNDGYDINLNNLGVKRTPAINDLQDIQIIPFPFRWISSLRSIPPTDISSLNTTLISPSYTVNNYHKITLNLPKRSIGAKIILVLNYSFNSGWKAYEIKQSKFAIANYLKQQFPFLFGSEIKSKVLVNNWANGWIVNNQTNNLSTEYIIFFLPQHLFYLGLIATGIAFGILIISWRKIRKSYQV